MYKVFVKNVVINFHPFKICSHDSKPEIQFNRNFWFKPVQTIKLDWPWLKQANQIEPVPWWRCHHVSKRLSGGVHDHDSWEAWLQSSLISMTLLLLRSPSPTGTHGEYLLWSTWRLMNMTLFIWMHLHHAEGHIPRPWPQPEVKQHKIFILSFIINFFFCNKRSEVNL